MSPISSLFKKSIFFPARRKFHSFPVRRRMLSVSSVSLSGDLSREAWANLQRLVLLGSMPRWAFVSSASPRRASHEPERRDWMSAFLKGRSHRCLSRTLSSPRQPSANQQNPAWESYRGRASCDSVVWKEGAVFLLFFFFLWAVKIEADTKVHRGKEEWEIKNSAVFLHQIGRGSPAASQRRRDTDAKFLEFEIEKCFVLLVCVRMWKRLQRDKRLVSVWYVRALHSLRFNLSLVTTRCLCSG